MMPRCPHGVYKPENQKIALYCGLCNPDQHYGVLGDTKKKFVMPRSVLTEQDGKIRANNHEPGRCPECGSAIHSVLERKLWHCEECGADYRAPRGRAA